MFEFALHLAILLWVLAVFPSGRALDAPMIEDVPIDIVTPSEFTKIKAGMVDEKEEAPLAPKPEEPKPKAVAEKEPPKPPKAEASTNPRTPKRGLVLRVPAYPRLAATHFVS